MSRVAALAAFAAALVALPGRSPWADEPPVSVFAQTPRIGDVSISPSGRYLAFIAAVGKVQAVVVKDRSAGTAPPHAVLSAGEGFSLLWCRWPSDARLLCGLHAPLADHGAVTPTTRLVGVDPDGKNVKVVFEDLELPGEQLIDRIIAWDVDGAPDTVLLTMKPLGTQRALSDTRAHAATDEQNLPAVYALDVRTGALKVSVPAHDPLTNFLADGHGEVRLGWGAPAAPGGFGPPGATVYEVRNPANGDWITLPMPVPGLRPVGLCGGAAPQCAYAIGPSGGRAALWRLDLTGKVAPTVEFSHPAVDVGAAFIARDGHLFGVRYDTDQPFTYFTDAAAGNIVAGLKRLLPDTFVQLGTYTADGRQMIILTTSDADAGTYYLYDLEHGTIARLGTAYPQLNPAQLARMRPISFTARDGTSVPGYLTTPPGATQHLPLVELVHGGPGERDLWQFDFLRAFLVSRGYAVLQVNYRGSSGYGSKWLTDNHGDLGGLSYSDILDGARWAVHSGLADPQRIAIMGSGQGGYEALLAAERNGDVFHCAVSLAGFSDLTPPGMPGMPGMPGPGGASGAADLRYPREHAADAQVPVLLVHGDHDAAVAVEQSKAMDAALTSAHRAHQFVLLPGADHYFSIDADRASMLQVVQSFLAANLGGVSAH